MTVAFLLLASVVWIAKLAFLLLASVEKVFFTEAESKVLVEC
jgi:hypothetical protein